MFVEGHAEERVHGFGSIVAGAVPVMSAQGMASPHNTGNGGTVTEVGGRDTGHSHCGEWRSDAVCPGRCGGVVGI